MAKKILSVDDVFELLGPISEARLKREIAESASKKNAKTIDDDDFECVCGNVSSSSGFDSCSKNGKRREPTRGWSGHYICNDCGALYQLKQNAAK